MTEEVRLSLGMVVLQRRELQGQLWFLTALADHYPLVYMQSKLTLSLAAPQYKPQLRLYPVVQRRHIGRPVYDQERASEHFRGCLTPEIKLNLRLTCTRSTTTNHINVLAFTSLMMSPENGSHKVL